MPDNITFNLIPALCLPPFHHTTIKLHQLLFTAEVSEVGVAGAPSEVVLVLPDHVGAGLAHPPDGLLLDLLEH